KLPEVDYEEFKGRIANVSDLSGQRLDEHRELYLYRRESGKIRVHDGQTWYLMDGDSGMYEVPVLNFEIDVKSILHIQGDQQVEAEL
ncbi:hypothetical protein GUG97_09235, partial [Xanthomonas citri pv. citri]|nr:hypothetical protein [Xanthomonas citri pv. citri]